MLEITGLSKRYGATTALDGVSLSVAPGSIHGLVGHNGAGKSTLIKCIAGAAFPDAGRIAVDGQAVRFTSPADAYRLGIRVIHQDAPLVGHFDTVDNAYLGRPHPLRHGLVDKRAMRAAVAAVAQRIAPHLPLDVPIAALSPSQKQFVRLVRAIADQGRILILDEPTAALPAEDADAFFAAVRALAATGTGIVLVSHRLDEIAALCREVTVIADGRVVSRLSGIDVSVPNLIAAMGGGAARQMGEKGPDQRIEPVLSLSGLRAAGLAAGVSFAVRPGEIVALYGLVGSGRSEILDAIWGATAILGGSMELAGSPFRPRGPSDALKAGISYVPADRHRTGLFRDRDLVFNNTLPLLSRHRRHKAFPVPHATAERGAFAAAARSVGLVFQSPLQRAATLSGGNQQKLIFSRWAGRHSRVMLLDEPTEGVDILAKAALRQIIRDMARDGNAILVSTSDRDEALELAHRVLVFRNGAVVASFDRAEASPARLSAAAQSQADAA